MSHFSLMAVGFETQDEFEELMDCYSESHRVAPYIHFTKKEITSDEFMKKYESLYKEAEGQPERFYKLFTEDELLDRDGNVLSTYNPDSRWDYYTVSEKTTVGEILEGSSVNEELCRATYRALADGDVADYERITGYPAVAGLFGRPTGEEFKKLYGNTEDEYVAYCKAHSFMTYCVLTPSGWEEPGTVGWFGMSSASRKTKKEWQDNYADRFLKPYNPDETVYIIDCHI